ncbi:MAG: 3-hydroxyacyl-CoA dehydrogenase/enoyl-CoA hydratase family protein [Candidatus Brocadiae bacterium]|nr:3-hydroxyacyl-CoA dehydrogenase/enoyl-CoA hydratase family protein [Candidatus Brocadiia bacterium]
MYEIKHVAVVGGGIMGGNIAAFFANLGITSDLFDIDPKVLESTMQKLEDPKAKIPMLYSTRFIKKIQPRLSSEMNKYLPKADLIVEAVPEKMSIKKTVFQEVDKHRKETSIVTTNTSGLSVAQMVQGLSESIQKHFVGTHYFNPVRFMPLVEIIPTAKTDQEIVAYLLGFYKKIGKQPIVCKDTPNFVANRIGVFALIKTLALMKKYNFDVETIDMITGSCLGNPSTATLRLSDMVGIDTIGHVSMNVYENCPTDEFRDVFKVPELMQKMIEEKKFGEKTGKGFYCKGPNKDILALDMNSWEYKPKKEARCDEVKIAKGYDDIKERIYYMCHGDSAINKFCRELLISTAAYSLNRVGESADDILTIDNAVKWGFKKEIGPIEVLDVFGIPKAIEYMQQMGIAIPKLLQEIQTKGNHIYPSCCGKSKVYDPISKDFIEIPERKDVIYLAKLKKEGKIVRENLSARMIDIGDDVLLVELDHRMVPTVNLVDDFVISMLWNAPQVVKEKGFKALVISNQATNFSSGAQLQLLLEVCKAKQWKTIEALSASLQYANMNLYHADFPVVVAPHGMTLGGGMEITLAGQKRVAYSELYGGLVEVGVGLLPGGAGCLLLLMQFMDVMEKRNPGPMPPAMKSLELIAYGSVSNSAHDAIDKGYLRPDDVVVVNKDELISKAKEVALSMLPNHQPKPKRELYLAGNGGYMVLEAGIDDMVAAGTLTKHGAVIAKKQAYVLTGGSKASPITPITEDEFLAMEREAFVQLCAEPMSQARIEYMLKNKKPLIN